MPQANNAELTELYTAELGSTVRNEEPNADGAAAQYHLIVQAVAGDPAGSNNGEYTLRMDCIDETLAERNADLSVDPVLQTFDGNTAGGLWVADGDDFKTDQTFVIDVPAGVQGHLFRYVATLLSVNNDIITSIESRPFVLVDPV
jgi:hypothetical protein